MPNINYLISQINSLAKRINSSFSRVKAIEDAQPKVYTALLTQNGTDAPVATVLQNTLGTVSINYIDIGSFSITSSTLFTENKTAIFFGYGSGTFDGTYAITYTIINSSTIELYTVNNIDVFTNGTLLNTSIKIEVYP